jgi:histidine ammonia-lyase
MEEHAGFAWQGARQATEAVRHVTTLVALEWVVAERALRMKGVAEDGVLGPIRALAGGFDPSLEDRPLGPDAALAETALPALARTVRDIVGIEL